MAKQYDGSINIDTRVDTQGMTQGVANVKRSLTGIGKIMSGIGTAASKVGRIIGNVIFTALIAVTIALQVIVAIITAAISLVTVIGLAFRKFVSTIATGAVEGSYMKEQFQQMDQTFRDLKGTFTALFSPLWIAILPVVTEIVNWFIKMLNIVQMVIAALLGQKTVMQYVAGSAKDMAQDTEDAQDAAEGALAAFDAINVLQMDKSPTNPNEGAAGEFIEVPIEGSILDWADKLKTQIADIYNNIKTTAIEMWDWITDKWGKFSAWFWTYIGSPIKERAIIAWNWLKIAANQTWNWMVKTWGAFSSWFLTKVWTPFKERAISTWERTRIAANQAWNGIISIWNKVVGWYFNNVWNPLASAAIKTWDYFSILAQNAWATISWIWGSVWSWFADNVWNPLKDTAGSVWDFFSEKAGAVLEFIKTIWGKLWGWYDENIISKLREGFGNVLDWIGEKFSSIFGGIETIVKNIVNHMIDMLNKLLSGAADVINALADILNATLGKVIPGWITIPHVDAPQIPKLASGAVIPPNAAFLALLGDQRSGRNLEAPEELLRQIVREETGAGREVTVKFAGSLAPLLRELKPYIDKENTRVGLNLAKEVSS